MPTNARVLVWKADTATMNPKIDPAIIAEAYDSDPEAAPDGRHHRLDAEDVERPPQIIDERGQTELGADIVECVSMR